MINTIGIFLLLLKILLLCWTDYYWQTLLNIASYWKKTRKHRLLKNSNNFNVIFHMMTCIRTSIYLSPLQTDATLLANNSQHSWMLCVASVCTPCCLLLCVIGAKFETSQTFESKTPNISFALWSPRRIATMLDLFAQLFQHCWGYAHALHMVSLETGKQ